MTEHKIVKQMIYISDLTTKYNNFEIWLREIANQLDIPTPIILPSHYKNFVNFHNAKFRPDDFVETLGCDMFVVEDCKE
ncbi:MAG: hypothetical protein RR416_01155 [Clostridia bacterium]